jgi:phosphopantetheine adenylyltransferase
MNKPIYELCRYQFTSAELRTLGDQLARETQQAIEIREERATVVAEFAAQLKGSEKRIAGLANKLNAGYEMREMECIVLYDKPERGMKTIVRVDTGEEVRTAVMTDAETQGNLFPAENPSAS